MKVVVNGEPTELESGATVEAVLDDGATVAAAVAALDLPASGRGVAVAVDAEVVPRGEWPAHELNEGARVEVLRAIQGG